MVDNRVNKDPNLFRFISFPNLSKKKNKKILLVIGVI